MQIRWPRGARRTLGNNGMSGGRAALFSLSTMFFLLLFFVSSGLSPVLCVRVLSFFLNRKPSIPVHFFSTVIHKFAQTFLRNFIDAENGKVYLPSQIEPEA
jgi:hypothetical protein